MRFKTLKEFAEYAQDSNLKFIPVTEEEFDLYSSFLLPEERVLKDSPIGLTFYFRGIPLKKSKNETIYK